MPPFNLDLTLPLVPQITAIPATINSLDLSENDLSRITNAQLLEVLAAIPHTVTSLDLTSSLRCKSSTELRQILAAIPASVTLLTFRDNDLGCKTAAELAEIVATIPATVTSLDLGWNQLERKTGAELAQVLRAIPDTVLKIALIGNDLEDHKSIDDWKAIFSTGKTITLSNRDSTFWLLQRIKENEQQRLALLAGFPPNLDRPTPTPEKSEQERKMRKDCAFFKVFEESTIPDKQVLREVFKFLG